VWHRASRVGFDAGYHVEMMWSPHDASKMDVLLVKQERRHEYEGIAAASRRSGETAAPACVATHVQLWL
jgi:predicted TIM-barrel fold metal-dependent hydrolase